MDRVYLETKVLHTDDGAVEGFAWKYDQADRIGDMIAPGAFKSAQMPISMCAFHDLDDPIGTWTSAEDRLAHAAHVKREYMRRTTAAAKSGRADMPVDCADTQRCGDRAVLAVPCRPVLAVPFGRIARGRDGHAADLPFWHGSDERRTAGRPYRRTMA